MENYRKRFFSREELLASEEFKKKDLSYCDLSNLDLSDFPSKTWKRFKFFHTNFKDTGIVFNVYKLVCNNSGKYCLEYCDFTNCDLHFLSLLDVSFKGSIFLNTGLFTQLVLNSREEIKDVVFSQEMYDGLVDRLNISSLCVETLKDNPHLPFSSLDIFKIVKNQLGSADSFVTSEKLASYNALIDEALEEDRKREGYLDKFYGLVSKSDFTLSDKVQFFKGFVRYKRYGVLDLESIPAPLIESIDFRNCEFKTLVLPTFDMDGLRIRNEDAHRFSRTNIPHVVIPSLEPTSWQEVKGMRRLGQTSFTMQTNLYLELGRACNAKCPFCRNQMLGDNGTNYSAIMNSLNKLKPYLNNVVVGGGEPTLKNTRPYLEQIAKTLGHDEIRFYVSTNGSCGNAYLEDLYRMRYRINLSRHAIEDEDNNQVFGIKTCKTEEMRDLMKSIFSSYLTLVATCFEGGLDSVESLERYIELSEYVGAKSVLFQSLHEDLDGSLDSIRQIDEMVFDEVIAHLREQGYFVEYSPIYSTGDYKLIIVKSSDNERTISFKRYIAKEELEREWPRATKRTFDLSLAPNGDIYQNWHQNSDKVIELKRKD